MTATILQRVHRPWRSLPDGCVVIAPTGDALHLLATATHVWKMLDLPATNSALIDGVMARWPEISSSEGTTTVAEILNVFEVHGLLERS